MDEVELQSRLSRISTIWGLLADSAGSSPDATAQRFAALIQRYQGAVYRYFLGALRDTDAADEVFQEFALRCLQGAFGRVDPHRGQFRKYLKTTLVHLIADYRRKSRKTPRTLDLHAVQPVALPAQAGQCDQLYAESWRDDLLARAWAALAQTEAAAGGPPHFSVLRFRTENPEASSAEMAARLNEQLRPASPFTGAGIRKTLERARTRFAEILVDDVAYSLGNPGPDEVAEELNELGLFPYCGSVLSRRRNPS